MKLSILDKIIEIYNYSGLSVSKFASIIKKDRRTVSSWINKEVTARPKEDVLHHINIFFRYQNNIWDEECQNESFFKAITEIPTKDVEIIEANREGRLQYILDNEEDERLIIHPKFPGSIYRDAINIEKFRQDESNAVKELKDKRITRMLDYSYKSIEWYDIKSLLAFCFSPIANFYTNEEKIQVLSLMIDTFSDNYNKQLFLYDSFSKKTYGFDTMYTSINYKKGTMFFKSPIESVFIEISNKEIVHKLHRYFTTSKEAPNHIKPYDATLILKILKSALLNDADLFESYKMIVRKTPYGDLFKNNISTTSLDKIWG